MSEIEQIEKDIQSIHKALECLAYMPSVNKIQLLRIDLNCVITDLRGLTYKLQKRIDKLKDVKSQKGGEA